ncbi:MAG: GAF domain-containing protein, partial [Armatimonadetes bacterium]|nr:GAF domain-containing protein [Anaerolineae bacterium]
MPQSHTYQDFEQLNRRIERANTSADAAMHVIQWYQQQDTPLAIALVTGELLTSVGVLLSAQEQQWLQTPANWSTLPGAQWVTDANPTVGWAASVLLIPLRVAGNDYGVLWLDGRDAQPDAQAVLIGALLAARLHSLQALDDPVMGSLQQQTRRLRAASQVSKAIISNFDLPSLLDQVVGLMQSEFGYDSVQILLLNDTQDQLVAAAAYTTEGVVDFSQQPRSFSLDETSLSAWVVHHNQPMVVNDVTQESRFRVGQLVAGVAAELIVPLQAGDAMRGVLVVQSRQPNAFSADDAEIMRSIADQIAIAIHNSRLFGELRARAQDMAALTEVSLLVNATLDISELAQRVYESVMRVQAPTRFQFVVLNRQREVLQLFQFEGEQRQYLERPAQPTTDLMSLIVSEATPVFWRNAQERSATTSYFNINGLDETAASYLGIPMISKEVCIGALCAQSTQPDAFDENDLQVLLTFANSAAVAIENAALFDSTTRRVRELGVLNEVSVVLARQFRGDDIWLPLHDQLATLFETSSFYIALYDRERHQLHYPLISEDGLRQPEITLPQSGIAAAAINYGTSLHFHDLSIEHDRLQALKVEFTGDEPDNGACSWLGVPFRNRRRESTGLICVHNVLPDMFGDDNFSLLTTIAAQISLALENASLLEAEQERRKIANTLTDVGQVVSSTLDIEEVLERVLEQIGRVVDSNSATIMLPAQGDEIISDEDGGCRLVARATSGASEVKGMLLDFKRTNPVMEVYHSQQPVVIGDVQQHSGWEDALEAHDIHTTRAWIGVPMLVQNRLVGIITLDKFEPFYYTDRDASTALALARQAAIAVDNARLHAQSQDNLKVMRKRARRLASMHQISTIISSTLDRETVLNNVTRLLPELFGVNHSGIVLLRDSGEVGQVVAEYPDVGVRGNYVVAQNGGLFQQLMASNSPIIVRSTDELDAPTREALAHA